MSLNKRLKKTKDEARESIGRIALVGGARPNFIKLAPLYHGLKKEKLPFFLVNTGQHFDKAMAGQFFREFDMKADYELKLMSKTAVGQIAEIMVELEKIFDKERPAVVIVPGDVNSTLACALTANKMKIPLAHIEAGLRSHNGLMQEETNRILTDKLSDWLFVTEESGIENLKKEGLTEGVILIGNIMIDTLVMFLPKARTSAEKFYFATIHRAENVDNKEIFNGILDALEIIARDLPIYLPLHPRTEKMAKKFGLMSRLRKIFKLLPPLSYQETIFYEKNAKLVLTDSGGVQEETSFLGTACLTLREETERPITVSLGTNIVAGVAKETILEGYRKISSSIGSKKDVQIPFWDGKASERIIKEIRKLLP